MKKRTIIKRICTEDKGVSMVFMLILIFVLTVIGSALLFAAASFLKVNKLWQASEDLYYKANRCSGIIAEKLEVRVQEILQEINIYEDSNEKIQQTEVTNLLPNGKRRKWNTLTEILNYYNSNKAAGDPVITETDLNNKLMYLISDPTVDEAIRVDASKAVYDIIFKIRVADTTNDSTNTDSIFDKSYAGSLIKDVIPETSDFVYVNRNDAVKGDIVNGIRINRSMTPIPTECFDWLLSIMTQPIVSYKYYTKTIADGGFDGIIKPAEVKYEIVVSNPIINIEKDLSCVYQLSSVGFNDAPDNIALAEAERAEGFTNPKLSKVLATASDITINGVNNITVTGPIYAFGKLPNDMGTVQKIDVDTVKGVNVDVASGKSVTITGNDQGALVTRGAISVTGEGTFTVNDSRASDNNIVCDTLIIPETGGNNSKVNINGNLSAYNDVRIDGPNATTKINGDFYGMSAGGATTNKSSSIILNDITSEIRIDGSVYVGGVAYAGNITNSGNAFQTGESASIGDNYKIYSYALGSDTYSSPNYNINILTDFKDWEIDDDAGQLINMLGSSLANQIAHFYHYIVSNKNTDPIAFIKYNFEPLNKGIILNSEKKHFATGIICAQMTNDPLNDASIGGKYYWLNGAYPWGASVPAGFAKQDSAYEPYSATQYGNKIDDGLGNGVRIQADNDVSYIKLYNYLNGNPNIGANRAPEFTDDSGVLGTWPQGGIDGNYYYFLTNSNTDVTIGGGPSNPSSGTFSDADVNSAAGKIGIIYTKGKIIIKPSVIGSIKGIFISNGELDPPVSGVVTGGIELDSSGTDFTLDYSAEAFDNLPIVRRFFSPANVFGTIQTTKDVYRSAESNIRLISKKTVKAN